MSIIVCVGNPKPSPHGKVIVRLDVLFLATLSSVQFNVPLMTDTFFEQLQLHNQFRFVFFI